MTLCRSHVVRSVRLAILVATLALALVVPAAVNAAPRLQTRVGQVPAGVEAINVHSAAMGRDIPLWVMRPKDRGRPHPTLYLLNGAGGGEDAANWFDRTDVVKFFARKNINVVVPMQGAFSYYTDWVRDDPQIGRNKWTTFLTRELPPVINSRLNTNGVNAIAGISMAGTSVLSLAQDAPRLYRAVGAYSGCAETSSEFGQLYIRMVVESRGGGDARNMWGPFNGPGWRKNDPVIRAGELRGTTLYVSNGSGIPGPHDAFDAPGVAGDMNQWVSQWTLGSVIEAATNQCTIALANRLKQLGIPATFNFAPVGTHSWGYWQDELHRSWPTLGAAIGRP